MDVESLACPVSVIADDSLKALRKFSEAMLTHKLGGLPYGPDSSRWPARWLDTVTLLQHEIDRADGAFESAKSAYIASQTR